MYSAVQGFRGDFIFSSREEGLLAMNLYTEKFGEDSKSLHAFKKDLNGFMEDEPLRSSSPIT